MEKQFSIRYASPYFLYIISLFTISNYFGFYCTNLTSFLSFISTSAFLCVVFLLGGKKLAKNSSVCIPTPFILISVTASLFLETALIQSLFTLASGEENGIFGKYVLSVIIISVAFICSRGKSYTALKLANIAFIIPIIVLILSAISLFYGQMNIPSVFISQNNNVREGILPGIIACILLFSDSYLINIMQTREKCYSEKNAVLGFTISAVICTVFGILFNGMFGEKLFRLLSFPVISSVGIIPGFDFEEIIMLAASVFIIYRFTCKLCVLQDFIDSSKIVALKKSHGAFFVYIFSAFSGIAGTALYISGNFMPSAEVIVAGIYFTVYILINIFSLMIHKAK